MNRSPLFYPLNRGMDAEAGGTAELQTDVMRFMAIISLCLVAIFAIVQSMPLMPELPPLPEPVEEVIVEEAVIKEMPPPVPVEVEVAAPEPVAPRPTSTATPVQAPAPSPVATEPAIEGFTLRFENDRALTDLVAGDEIALYAVAPDQAYKMRMSYGRIDFRSSDKPQQFHEMEQSTVPSPVLNAFRRLGSMPPKAVKWGVTLPADMSQSLNNYLREHSGGHLVIHSDGVLRMEQ